MQTKRVSRYAPSTERDDLEELLAWVSSLPWVVERDTPLSRGTRMFGIECEPLGKRQTWLVVGLGASGDPSRVNVSVVLPKDVAHLVERVGWGRRAMPMPNGRELVKVPLDADPGSLSAVVVTAYKHAAR